MHNNNNNNNNNNECNEWYSPTERKYKLGTGETT